MSWGRVPCGKHATLVCWGLERARSGSSYSQTGLDALPVGARLWQVPGVGMKLGLSEFPSLAASVQRADGGITCGHQLQPVRVIKV